MEKESILSNIENNFRSQVNNDKNAKNSYLLVHSGKLGVNLYLAEGKTEGIFPNPKQPNHLASVGKLFTSTLVGILHEKGKLDFTDKISNYLEEEIMDKLHVYKGKDYSNDIEVRHLLNQTSGLNDVFYELLKKILENPETKITTREAVIWGKENLKPKSRPGERHFYGDTNYYLLGLIVESITNKRFHEAMHELIFQPLDMKHAYMFGFSKPLAQSEHPTAGLFINEKNLLKIQNLSELDYAGGSVVAPLDEYLKFMKALVNHEIIKKETLETMLNDYIPMGFPFIGTDYGYGIWKYKTVPIIIPEKYNCWGCVGVTGAYMFYHPKTESYLIGTFNDIRYKRKAVQFMLFKVIKELLKIN